MIFALFHELVVGICHYQIVLEAVKVQTVVLSIEVSPVHRRVRIKLDLLLHILSRYITFRSADSGFVYANTRLIRSGAISWIADLCGRARISLIVTFFARPDLRVTQKLF